MSKKDEALKLALEAVSKANDFLFNWHENESDAEADAYATARQLGDKAITAIREALAEQPAQQPYCDDCGGFDPECPLAQPAQQKHVLEVRLWRDKNHDQHAEFRGYDKLPDGKHVFYTSQQPAQPSKPWVGLTDEEKTEIRRETYALPLLLMEAIEAKLREKNS